ncbi:helix-turn-helix domain-containing protein [Jiangella gansuensis]|uniref:helix-turn-helix domain-containing protein n=1 Tax=Jiangella gansuensis TaxID=281473 RepID=UPI000478BD80|nr:helix-turn-helix domain-containing protein [Jiangella gansuensis]
MSRHEVVVLALEAVVPLDLSIPAQVFADRHPTPYRVTVCAATPGDVVTTAGFSLRVAGDLSTLQLADTVVVPGFWPHTTSPGDAVLEALAAAHRRGARLISICTGAFALAAAGVLDGRTATTHWRYADQLAEFRPSVAVNRNALYVDEGDVLTSAGVAAGIDLCLHVVRRDLGSGIANSIARDTVAAPHREGGQSQFVERWLPPARGTSLAATRAWASTQLHRPLAVADLARHAGLSERTLGRRFVAETGVSPLRWLLAARIDLARELLERDDLSIEQIADRCGLGTPANLRNHFRRLVGTAPRDYRRMFSSGT